MEPKIDRIQSHAHAAKSLPDAQYIAYVLVQMFKLGTALLVRRWPSVG